MTNQGISLTTPEDSFRLYSNGQDALARLGLLALTCKGLSGFFQEVVQAVAQALSADLCVIFEADASSKSLSARTGSGAKDGNSPAGQAHDIKDDILREALGSPNALVMDGLGDIPQSQNPWLQDVQGVSSGVVLAIRGEARPFGLLGVFTKLSRTFTKDEIGFLQNIAHLLAAAIHRFQIEDNLVALNGHLEERVTARTKLVVLLQQVAEVANEANTIPEVMGRALDMICAFTGWPLGHVFYCNSTNNKELISTSIWSCAEPKQWEAIIQATARVRQWSKTGLPGSVLASGKPEVISNLNQLNFSRAEAAAQSGIKAGFAFPLLVGKDIVAVMEFFCDRPIKPDAKFVEVLAHIGSQLGRVVERKRNEEAMRASEARFRTIFESSAIGISIIDLTQRFLVANPTLQEMLGYNKQELLGMEIASVIPAPDLPTVVPRYQAVFAGKAGSANLEQRFLKADGGIIWGSVTITLIRNDDGSPRFAILLVEDITTRKMMEAELAEVNKRLIASRELERLYLAQELHDEPLQELYGLLYQLEDLNGYVQGEENSSGLQEAQSAVNRIIDTLRGICRELRPPALAHFGLEGAIRELAERFLNEHPEINLHLDLMYDGRLLSEQVRLTLYRILQQALSNVARHAQASNVYIRFKYDQDQASLEVEDDGSGFSMPPRWVAFVREGHLGLAGAAERAETVNGRFQVVSSPGNGTTLRVTVPRDGNSKDLGKKIHPIIPGQGYG